MDGLEDRMTDLTHEHRTRTLTMETAILSSIRDLGVDVRRRLDDHEVRIRRLEDQ
jgi:hypothetical protein